MGTTSSKTVEIPVQERLDALYQLLDKHIGGIEYEERYLCGYVLTDHEPQEVQEILKEIDLLETDMLYGIVA